MRAPPAPLAAAAAAFAASSAGGEGEGESAGVAPRSAPPLRSPPRPPPAPAARAPPPTAPRLLAAEAEGGESSQPASRSLSWPSERSTARTAPFERKFSHTKSALRPLKELIPADVRAHARARALCPALSDESPPGCDDVRRRHRRRQLVCGPAGDG